MGNEPVFSPPGQSTHILDALDALVYVADLQTYKLLYANKYARDLFGEITGKICWKTFQSGQDGPCPFCTNHLLVNERGEPAGVHVWEFQNTVTARWYLIRDQAIPWNDGRLVRLEIATDITERKRSESIAAALHDLSDALWTARNLKDYCGRAHDVFKTAIEADNFFVGLLDKDKDRVVFPYFADATTSGPFEIADFASTGKKSLTGRVIETGKPLFLKKNNKLEQMAAGELAPVGPLSEAWMGVPLLVDGEAIGVLGVQSYDDPNQFDERDLELLVSAASLMAMTIRRHRDAQALRESEERHKALSRASFESLFISDKGACLDANAAAVEMFGYAHAEMLHMRGEDFLTPDTRPIVLKNMLSGFEEPYEAIALRKDGSTFPCEIQGRMFRYKGKDVRVTALRDISERKRAEAALRESEERFRSIVQNSPLGLHLYELAPDGRLILIEVNPAADSQSVSDNARYIGKPVEEVLTGVTGTPYVDILKNVAATGEPWNAAGFQYQGSNISGYFDVWAFQTSKGRMALMFQNASDRFKAEKALVAAKEGAERASRSRSEFLANMSHELRTPLNGIFGMLQLVKQTALTPEQESYVDVALSTGNSLLTIIDDVLDFSKMDAGELDIDPKEFNIRQSLQTVVDNFSASASDKGIALSLDIAPNVPERLIGDDGRLRQILFNLIGNAVKFTGKGSVSVSVSPLPNRRDNEMLLLFCVADTGIGIPDAWVRDVFIPFTQVDGGYNRRFKGTGLGLSIVRKLISILRGSLSIETEEGVGSSIYFTLPLTPGRGRPLKPAKAAPQCLPKIEPLRILVAEDETINLMALRLNLEKCGHSAACARDGREALKLLAEQPFDLILMDIQMPGMDGLEATGIIRSSSDPAVRGIPIIALTAHAMKGDREKFMAAGMDGYLSKPLDFEELQKTISALRATAK